MPLLLYYYFFLPPFPFLSPVLTLELLSQNSLRFSAQQISWILEAGYYICLIMCSDFPSVLKTLFYSKQFLDSCRNTGTYWQFVDCWVSFLCWQHSTLSLAFPFFFSFIPVSVWHNLRISFFKDPYEKKLNIAKYLSPLRFAGKQIIVDFSFPFCLFVYFTFLPFMSVNNLSSIFFLCVNWMNTVKRGGYYSSTYSSAKSPGEPLLLWLCITTLSPTYSFYPFYLSLCTFYFVLCILLLAKLSQDFIALSLCSVPV